MQHFRLIFRPDVTILERNTKYGICHAQELHPEKFNRDAELIDSLVGYVPNRETENAIGELERGEGKFFENVNDLFDDLHER